MQVSVSRTSPVQIELKVVLPKELVESALNKAYQELGRTAQIRGFRKGKVPLPMLKKYFADRVQADVGGKLVNDSLNKALTEQKLDPVVEPKVQVETVPVEGREWGYSATFEVRPEITDIVLEGIEVTRPIYTVTDHDVEHQLEHLREKHSTLHTPEPARPVQAEDFVTLSYDVSLEGVRKEDMAARERTVQVGKGLLLDALDQGILGMNVGDSKDIEVSFPETHSREDVRGKKAVLTVTVSDLKVKQLPAITDELAKDEGAESLEALKARVRGELEQQGKDEGEREARDAAVLQLAEKNPIAVPPSMIAQAVNLLVRETVQQYRMNNESFEPSQIWEEAKAQAEQRVRAALVLGELARRNSITVGDADLEKRLQEMADKSKRNINRLRAEYRDPKKMESLANMVLEDKVLTLLLSKITVTEKPAEKPLHEHHD